MPSKSSKVLQVREANPNEDIEFNMVDLIMGVSFLKFIITLSIVLP